MKKVTTSIFIILFLYVNCNNADHLLQSVDWGEDSYPYNEHDLFFQNYETNEDDFGAKRPTVPPLPVPPALKIYWKIRKHYLPVPSEVDNGNCSAVVGNFLQNIQQEVLGSWALKMFDSWGKSNDGLLFGNIHLIGMYEECMKISDKFTIKKSNETINFVGKYCTIYYANQNVSMGRAPPNDGLVRSGPGLIYVVRVPSFNYATCMPSVCNSEDLETSMNVTLSGTDRRVSRIVCTGEDTADYYDAFDKFISAVIYILVILVVFGTILDAVLQNFNIIVTKKSVQTLAFIICCFSFGKNFKKIFQYKKKSSTSEVTCLHGMRVITLIWIITCHQYQTGLTYAVNTANAGKYQDPYFGQMITNGYPSVDTFFCISGMLIVIRLFPAVLDGKGLLIYPKAFFRRIARLSPSIFIVAGFSATVLRFLGWGPRSPYLTAWTLNQCRGNWWKDFLFIDNYVIGENHGYAVNDCLGHCWFTAVDMQLFLIVPLILIPLGHKFHYGVMWLSFLTLWSMIIPGVIIYTLKLPPLPMYYLTIPEHFEYMQKYYLVPWCRAAPWFIGIWAGLFIVKKPRCIPTPKSIFVVIGYMMSLVIGLSIVLGMYQYNHVGDHNPIKLWLSAFYAAFSRPAWAVGVAWVAITCHAGHGGIANAFLSWWGWQPLSRLTFCMYLISPVVQLWWASVQFVPPYYNYFGKLFEVCGVFFVSFVCAVLVAILVERPILEMTNGLRTTQDKKSLMIKPDSGVVNRSTSRV